MNFWCNRSWKIATQLRTVGASVCVCAALILIPSSVTEAQLRVTDQHRISWHRAEDVTALRRPPGTVPVTVASEDAHLTERLLPLDEAIRTALSNAEVVRVLNGVSASSSGQTIYDTASATTPIDQAVARFDPIFSANSSWRKTETPGAVNIPLLGLGGSQVGGNDLSARLSRTNRLGGVGAFEFSNNWNYGIRDPTAIDPTVVNPGVLDPVHRPALELSYTQPLLAGAGRSANEAPIVIAQLELDRSYFQFKGSMQELLRGVITAYWSLVEARTQLWAREKQVEASKAALDRVEAQFRAELADIGDVAQPRVAYANFNANLVTARGNVIQREAALRNILGLPPEDGIRLVPSTPPTRDRVKFDWDELVNTAQLRRPDLVELNLILHADRQRLVQASNQAKPTLNAVGIQRWNGITGRVPGGGRVGSGLDDNPAWSLGVTFEVPLSLRSARANARTQELLIARDRANIQQGLHATEHALATSVRNLAQFYEQYEAFRETRDAARINLQVQFAEQRAGRVIFLNVLQAITSWGDAVSSEALSLTQYNSGLAVLEQETGTILDTHGIVFVEERFAAVGPFGKHFELEYYPRSLRPGENAARYEDSGEAAEEVFDLEDFPRSSGQPESNTRAVPDPPPPSRPVNDSDQASAEHRKSRFSLRRLFSFRRSKK